LVPAFVSKRFAPPLSNFFFLDSCPPFFSFVNGRSSHLFPTFLYDLPLFLSPPSDCNVPIPHVINTIRLFFFFAPTFLLRRDLLLSLIFFPFFAPNIFRRNLNSDSICPVEDLAPFSPIVTFSLPSFADCLCSCGTFFLLLLPFS